MLQEPQPELQAGAVVVLVVSGLEPPLVESSDTCSVAGTLVGRARHTSVALRTTSGRRSTPEAPMHSGEELVIIIFKNNNINLQKRLFLKAVVKWNEEQN